MKIKLHSRRTKIICSYAFVQDTNMSLENLHMIHEIEQFNTCGLVGSSFWRQMTWHQHDPSYHRLFLDDYLQIDGLAQDCGNSIANALELPQPCTKPMTCQIGPVWRTIVNMHWDIAGFRYLHSERSWVHIGMRLKYLHPNMHWCLKPLNYPIKNNGSIWGFVSFYVPQFTHANFVLTQCVFVEINLPGHWSSSDDNIGAQMGPLGSTGRNRAMLDCYAVTARWLTVSGTRHKTSNWLMLPIAD